VRNPPLVGVKKFARWAIVAMSGRRQP